jgi:hypothetical protein
MYCKNKETNYHLYKYLDPINFDSLNYRQKITGRFLKISLLDRLYLKNGKNWFVSKRKRFQYLILYFFYYYYNLNNYLTQVHIKY